MLFVATVLAAPHAFAAPAIRVMALGDSITAGYADHNYRAQLSEKALSIGCDLDFVGQFKDTLPSSISSHSAIWGVHASTVEAAYIDTWMKNARPDVVLMMLGVNDIQGGGRTPAATIYSLRSIIGKIRANNPYAEIFLGKYPGIRPDLPAVKVLNDMLPALARELSTIQSPVFLVDHSPGYNIAVGADNGDLIHPNKNGDGRYAYNWFKAMVEQGVCAKGPVLVNAAENKPASASVNPYGYGNPFLAVNGAVNDAGWTRLVTDGRDQVLEIDLQGTYNLRYFELSHYNGATQYNTKAYRIEVSNDRQSWQSVVAESNNSKPRSTHKIAPVDARYVRLTAVQPFYGNLLTIREFRAMGVPVSAL